MPLPPPKRNLLLIEQYGPLAFALEVALRKFAPQFRVTVAGSLTEARRAAEALHPELIILDYDPPLAGTIGLLQELQRTLPKTRALVIAAGTSREIAAERGSEGALQFLEKPFDLSELGAALQALLAPWRGVATARGTLQDLGLADVILLACIAGATVVVQAQTERNRKGEVHLHNGHIIHAAVDNEEGARALATILSWKNGRFSEHPAVTITRRTIQSAWPKALLQALRDAKQVREQTAASIAAAQVPLPTARVRRSGAKVLVIDDTEMLVMFVEDSLRLADPTLQITTALTGLHGVKEAVRLIPDLVLVDYSLPDIKGDEVCRRLGSEKATARVPIIMMSGHVQEMTAAAVKLPNVVATVAKPFLSDALIAVVQQTLREGPLRQPVKFLPVQAPVAQGQTLLSKANVPQRKSAPLSGTISPVLQPHLGSEPRVTNQTLKSPPARTLPQAPQNLANEVLLDLPLEVVAMQVNSSFQIGAIRARPASPTVAIEIPSTTARALLVETAFRLTAVELDSSGRIANVRLLPTPQRFNAPNTRAPFEIGAVVAGGDRERVQLISAATSRMIMQLLAPFELVAVELSERLEVAQLVLRRRGNAVRVSLNSHGGGGTMFQTAEVRLDTSGRIAELTLAPVK